MADAPPVDLTQYSNQFDEIESVERTPVIDLNGINALSELRYTTLNIFKLINWEYGIDR